MLRLAELVAGLEGTDREIATRFSWPSDWRTRIESNRKFKRKAFAQLSSGKSPVDKLVSGEVKGKRREGYTVLSRHPRRFKLRY